MARRSRRKSTGRKVDFSEAVKWFEPDMEVGVEIKTATWEDGAEYPYIAVELKGIDEEYEDSTMFHNATTSPKALDRLRNFLEAFGLEVPEGEMDIDTEELIGLKAMCHTYEDRYTKQDGSKGTSVKPDDFWPLDEDDGDKKSSKKGAGKKSSKKEPELLDREEVEGMDRDDLEALVEEHELDVDLKNRKIKRNDEALLEAVIAELEEKELLEEEKKSSRGKKDKDEDEGKSSSRRGRRGKKDEEEEEKTSRSKRGSKGSSKKSATWSADDIGEMSEEELDDVVEQAELELDLSDFSTLRKKKNAVIDALEEADKLSD